MKGIVLAGGKSRRFGSDKALAQVDGVPMLQRAVDLLSELKLDPCVITNEEQAYPFLDCETRVDSVPNQGPLGGVFTALCAFKSTPLLILTCDMPALHKDVLCFLMKERCSEAAVTVFCQLSGAYQPFPGIYRSELAGEAKQHIEQSSLSMQQFIHGIANKQVLEASVDQRSFRNINSPRDYQANLKAR